MKASALSLRTLVPLALMALALLVSLINYLLQVREYRALVLFEQSEALTERLGVEQSAFDFHLANDNLPQLRRAVAELGLRPNLTHAYLVAPGGRIVGSLARAEVGRSLTEPESGPVGEALLGLRIAPDRSLTVESVEDGRALQAALVLGAGHRLLVRSDIERPLAQRLHASRLELWRDAITIVLSALLLALFLHLAWFRRAQTLADAAHAVGLGRLDTRVNLGGRDELSRISHAFNDMAEKLQAQHAALRDSEMRMRAMFEQAGVGVARIDSRVGRFIEVNAKFCEITGYERHDLMTMAPVMITHPDDLADDRERMAALRRGDLREYTADVRLLHRHGHTVHVTLSVTPLWTPDREPDHHIAVVQDITARVQADLALKLERNRLNAAERIAGLGSWEFHRATGRGWWSEQMFALFRLDPAEGVPDVEAYLKRVHPEDRERMAGVMDMLARGAGEVPVGVYRTSPESGPVRHLQPSVQAVTDDDGRVVRYAGTLLDVSHVVMAERALRSSEERLRATLEYAPNVAVQWYDRRGRVLYWNHASTTLYGWSADQAMGRDVGELMMGADEAQAFVAMLSRIELEKVCVGPLEYTLRRRGGTPCQVEASVFSIPGSDGVPIFVCMEVDVTARRAAEEAVEKERTYLQTLFSVLPDYVWVKAADGRYLSCNRMLEQFFGQSEDTLIGKTDHDLFPPDQADVFRKEDEMTMRSGRRSVYESQVVSTATGCSVRVQTVKVPMRSESGNLIGVLGMARDITELRDTQDQLRELNAELEQRVIERTEALSAAMKELESFSYAVSHDLKAPLRGIDGYSRILLEDYGSKLDEQAIRFIGNIRNGAAQMHALIEDLLAYSRMERRTLEASRVDLGELTHSVLARRADEIQAASAQVVGEIPALIVRADRQGADLVLRNLLDNALKFSRDAKPPVITLSACKNGDRILMSIRDNGIGFDMKYHERIFEIFQRLHRSDEFAGTGVGLALVRKAMQRMGGRVWAESAPGEGACFNLEFPA